MKQNKQLDTKATAGTREGFGQAMMELAKENPNVVALCADLTTSLRLKKFEEKYPDRFIQVGVAEQNMVSVAAGLALGGKIPFAASYAVFNPGRTWDQIRVSICYSSLNVKLIGGHTGLSTGPDGATHQALEDLALVRVLPNMAVIVPCDNEEARKATHAIAQKQGPCYLRLGRTKVADVTNTKTNFKIGQANTVKEGSDVTIIACGIMVQKALVAAEQLAKENISVRVVNMHTIKPIDKKVIIKAANETKLIVTAEEHQITGGLGSAVAEIIVQETGTTINKATPVRMIGMQDCFGESGSAEELLEKYGLTSEAIYKTIKETI